MFDGTEPFRSAPRISRARFVAMMNDRAALSVLAERDPGTYWDVITATGIDPLLIAAMFNHESTMGRYGVATQTHSWGNTREPSFGAKPIGSVPGASGVFPVFRDWLDGCKSTAARLAAPDYVYAERVTIRDIFDWPKDPEVVWAPAGDFNDPHGYLRAVLDFMNQYTDGGEQAMPGRIPKPPIIVKHITVNMDGYSTPRQVQAIVWHISRGSLASNLAWFANPASGASTTYEIGKDGTIYEIVDPDHSPWTNGPMNKPDTSNPLIAAWKREGINPNTRTETMELEGESQMLGGADITPAQRDSLVWLTAWRCQERGLPPDRTHILGHDQIDSVERSYCPGFPAEEWHRLIADVAAFGADREPASAPSVNPDYFEETGKFIHPEFSGRWHEDGLDRWGYPITGGFMEVDPLHPDDGPRLTQYFQRGVMRLFPENEGKYRVQGDLLGIAVLKTRYPEGAPA